MDSEQGANSVDEQPLEEALLQLAATAPTYHGRLANHGPMACEALVRLGRADAVERWLDSYLPDLEEAPRPGHAVDATEWHEALGRTARYPDWLATFASELAADAWPTVLEGWLPRLLPGALTGGTHGLIRTAHATRALERFDSAARRSELATALAYWASAYQGLPGTPRPIGSLSITEAVTGLPLLPEEERTAGRIHDEATRAGNLDGFGLAVNALAPPGSLDEALSELTRIMAGHYLAHAEHSAIAFVHGVTAPAALRLLLPHLREEEAGSAFARVWQVCAALYAAYGTEDKDPAARSGEQVDIETLVDAAVHIGGAHAIKLTEACLREHARDADPVYLRAATDGVGRLSF